MRDVGVMAHNSTEQYLSNDTVTTDIPRSIIYEPDYIDFELPVLVVVTVLFCLSGFILCTRARRNWNRQYRQRQTTQRQASTRSTGSPVPLIDWSLSGIMTSKLVISESESPRPAASSILISRRTTSLGISAYRNPGFSSSNSAVERCGSVTAVPPVSPGPYVIPTQMVMPPTYIDLPPSYEDVLKETGLADSAQINPEENVENCIIQESNPQVVDSLSTQTESPTAQP